ncbi:hypothetical protein GGX14DRAFT_405770 [Mycena pura]|uniref:Uncharacterized protein n=1 Tax=Mycena pura TaxID=153505 RepID=A0AAD6URK4_9AGAR|nr:hypothetical protein GGX14DRAFT_405769 [Mycena pura]KAJ7193157.1 hypothetical protein GGX14DRAFT_405770 [Mycena pura]
MTGVQRVNGDMEPSNHPAGNTTHACDNSSGITLIINLHGPGPFNLNLNINTSAGPPVPTSSQSPTPETPRRNASRGPVHHVGRDRPFHRSSSRGKPYSRPLRARQVGPSHDEEVPETPQSQLELLLPPTSRIGDAEPPLPALVVPGHSVATESQDVQAADSPQSDLSNSSVTELDEEESVARFSPNNPLVTPTRKLLGFPDSPLNDYESNRALLRSYADEEEEETQR